MGQSNIGINMKWFIALTLVGLACGQDWGDHSTCGQSGVSNHGACQNVEVADPADSGRKIVGGWEVTAHELPYQAGFTRSSGSFFCGGTIIREDTVLTAAYCTSGMSASGISITLGDHQRNQANSNRITRQCTQIIQHNNYQPLTINNDISLLKMSSISFNDYMRPACQPQWSNSDLYVALDAVISGWRSTRSGGSVTQELRAVCAPFITKNQCRNSGYSSASITEAMLCAGDVANGGVDACQGDSGGPLCYKRSGRMEIVGIVSWGSGCAQANYPGVYADVPYFQSWISNNID